MWYVMRPNPVGLPVVRAEGMLRNTLVLNGVDKVDVAALPLGQPYVPEFDGADDGRTVA